MTIDKRNQCRAEAGLPLLDVEAERARLAAVHRDAAFEQYYRQHRNRFARLWADTSKGWLSRAGLWAQARRQLRAEFEAAFRQQWFWVGATAAHTMNPIVSHIEREAVLDDGKC